MELSGIKRQLHTIGWRSTHCKKVGHKFICCCLLNGIKNVSRWRNNSRRHDHAVSVSYVHFLFQKDGRNENDTFIRFARIVLFLLMAVVVPFYRLISSRFSNLPRSKGARIWHPIPLCRFCLPVLAVLRVIHLSKRLII